MRVSREQAAASRERILDTASRLFRERGLDGIGVADLMNGAGLTHGGFYGHFASKEELMAQACARALRASVQRWERIAEGDKREALSTIVKSYLSTRHRDSPGTGCALAMLGGDLARQAPAVRGTATGGVDELIGIFTRLMPGRTKAARRKQAMAAYSSMVGALVLARAVDDAKLSKEILAAASDAILT
jgi:TetR/AcrR family transcriptional repressor of nem operon